MMNFTEYLPNLYLENGYEDFSSANYNFKYIITGKIELRKSLAEFICWNKPRLNGQEFRFIRRSLPYPNVIVITAKLFGLSETTIRGWEKDRAKVPGPADRLMRMLYLDEKIKSTKDFLENLSLEQPWPEGTIYVAEFDGKDWHISWDHPDLP